MSESDLHRIVRKFVRRTVDRWGHERIYLRVPFAGGIDQIALSGTKLRDEMDEELVARLVRFIELVDKERK